MWLRNQSREDAHAAANGERLYSIRRSGILDASAHRSSPAARGKRH
jgi:hypothetical protein